MFSGIVEEVATVIAVTPDKDNLNIRLQCTFAGSLKTDQSISHNGVCLTTVTVEGNTYTVTAVRETLLRSNLGTLKPGDKVNVERSIQINGRLDGHIVQGHVDTTAICTQVEDTSGSWLYTFQYTIDKEKAKQGYITVEKGSICVNGVSLTVCNSRQNSFQTTIIPYTYEQTNFHNITAGTVVNLEFDIIGKYISKITTII
ncbi:MAG: riboflavin synthase [Dysgonamonadaceae bacterium]|jgi:riboflavin synthase|nr:riboflavin synthase [Dysgonamonadaceae bacterium]